MVWSQRWAGPAWTFALAVAGAFALQALKEHFEKTKIQKMDFIVIIGSAVFMLLGYFALIAANIYKYRYVDSNYMYKIYTSNATIEAAVVMVIVLVCFGVSLVYYAINRSGVYAVLTIAAFELWLAVPRGYDADWRTLKLVMFVPAAGIALAFIFDKKRVAAIAIAAFAAIFFLIDATATHGFPERYDPFTKAPYVDFLKNKAGYSRVMAIDGVLFPNFASAISLYDVRYINALSIPSFVAFRNEHMLTRKINMDGSDPLWFTGRPMMNDFGGAWFNADVTGDFLKQLNAYSFRV